MGNVLNFSLTPELDSETRYKSGFKIKKIAATYVHNGETRKLEMESDLSLAFEDPRGVWSIEEYGMTLQYQISFVNPSALFSENGICGKNDILGIAVRLLSQKSRQRIILKDSIHYISYREDELILDITATIPANKFREVATSELFLFMAKPSEESRFIRQGTMFGVLDSKTLSFSGDSSDFPIDTDSINANYLWKLYIDCEDPHTDMFNQCVSLTLNEKHPRFKSLKLDDDPLSDMVFREIMSQALFLIISKMQHSDYYEDIVSNNNLEPGSIGQAVFYMISNLESDATDPLALSDELHALVAKRAEGSDD